MEARLETERGSGAYKEKGDHHGESGEDELDEGFEENTLEKGAERDAEEGDNGVDGLDEDVEKEVFDEGDEVDKGYDTDRDKVDGWNGSILGTEFDGGDGILSVAEGKERKTSNRLAGDQFNGGGRGGEGGVESDLPFFHEDISKVKSLIMHIDKFWNIKS